MYELIRKENNKAVLFEWTPARQKAFEVIKAKLATVSVMTYPNFDKLFILYMDISDGSVGAILH